jgi:hypothetical protein
VCLVCLPRASIPEQSRLHEIKRQGIELSTLTKERDDALYDCSCWMEAAKTMKNRYLRLQSAFHVLQRKLIDITRDSAGKRLLQHGNLQREMVTPADPNPVATKKAMALMVRF